MSEIDRPIKPDPKYLEEYIQRINKVQIKPYLKKKSNPLLPCYAQSDDHHHSPQRSRQRNIKTKAEIYEEIKRKNLQKFGDRKAKPIIIEQNVKKLNPSKMTINYKAKPLIDTSQYKKKGYVPHPKTSHTLPQDKQKIEYEKLIDYFNKELKDLQHEKEEFNKVAEKLKFKESIRNQEGLFYGRVKSEVQRQMINTQPQKEEDKNQVRTNHQSRQNTNKNAKIAELKGNLSKTYSAGQIRNKLEKTCSQLQLLKSQMMHQTLEVKQHRYEVFQVHLLPSFSPQAIYDFIDLSTLKYNGNSLYKAAMKAFNSKFGKQNKELNQEEVSELGKPSIKQKYFGQKRVSKYEDWTEVWTPGKQRLMANHDNYKVVWLANGDVIQEFGNAIKTYYSKAKQILKIQFKDFPPIYFHQELNQIWRYLSNGSREIIFSNGRLQIVENNVH